MKIRNVETQLVTNSKEEKGNSSVSGEIQDLSDNWLKSNPEWF